MRALDDTPVCPTYNQESPPLDWDSTQTPTAWGQIDTKQPKTKAKGQEGKNPRSRNKGAKGYGRKFRCYRYNFTGHSSTDWEIIKTYQKSKQENTESD